MQKHVVGCITMLILVLLLTLAGCSKKEPVKEEVPLVRSQTIKLDAIGQNASYPGEVRGRYEAQLAFQASGKLIKRNVELGSVVAAGDVLMEIDSKDIQQTVNITSAQVASSQSQLNLAEVNLERYRKLYEQNAISRAQLDQYENAYQVALAAVNQATAQYAQGANQLGYTSLVADSEGIVSSINVEAGQVVSAGQSVMTLVKGSEREIEISVPENRIDEMRSAKQVSISFWALPGVIGEGKVREISPVADKVTRTYKVRISLVNPPPAVKLGMTASVAVGSSNNRQGVYIPLAAIYQTGDTPNVWVIREGVVILRPIKVGVFGDNTVQVIEGLQDGEVIVTGGVQKLREGQKVRI